MIRIVVDSSSDYTLEEIKEKNLTLIPLIITIDGKSFIEGENLERNEFYEFLKSSQNIPKTSQPSPEAFLNVFEAAKAAGDDVICILLSSTLSGTYQNAFLAKMMTDYDRIHIIDSRSVASGLKLMADYALKLIDDGLTAEAIVEKVEDMKSRVHVFAALDTLDYLYKGGRLSKTSAAIGTLARLKPIITLNAEGRIEVVGKAIGKQKAMSSLISNLEEFEPDEKFPFTTLYTYDAQNCEKLEEKLLKNGIQTSYRTSIGAAIGTHAGPGAFGIVYVSK